MQFKASDKGIVVTLASSDRKQFSRLYETVSTLAKVFPDDPNYTAFVVTLNSMHRRLTGDDVTGWDEGWQSRFNMIMERQVREEVKEKTPAMP
jgi:hypothetical protein